MWARVVEFMVACWLALSPFIFHYKAEETFLWANDFICSFLISCFAFLSYYEPIRKIHLLSLGVSFWLFYAGYHTFPEPATGALQNYVVVSLVLMMLNIIPTDSSLPPRPWRDFFEK
jgi:hypothetical protein